LNLAIAVAMSCAIVLTISAGIFFSGIQYAKHNSTEILKSIRAQTYSGWEQKIKEQAADIDELKLIAAAVTTAAIWRWRGMRW